MNVTDEFLREKVDAALGGYFRYLAPALRIVRSGTVTIGSPSEKKLLARYNLADPKFQARASTFVLEAFHAVELLLKSLLVAHGQYLVFESLDDYLDRLAAAPDANRRRDQERERLLKTVAASARGKKDPPTKVLKEYAAHVLRAPVENFGKSVSARVAFKRLLHFEPGLEKAISEEAFARLVGLRNQIVHFGEMANLLQGVTDALQSLLILCQWRAQTFPRLAQVPAKYAALLPAYNELVQHLMLREAWPRLMQSVIGMWKHNGQLGDVKPDFDPKGKAG